MVFRLLFVLTALVASACSRADRIKVALQKESGETVAAFRAEVAATAAAREIGLMYRKELADDEGMLFIFPTETERSFWMKNTYLELDMIFVNSANRVVSVVDRAVPLTETARKSEGPALYVLEIKGGKAKSLGIAPGMLMKVEGALPAAS